ncbi:unnamed protein product [Mytilus coruscus]|uniref:WSC domain-containing protein n=1 Tax=Mytilus coruscus TaxID=42192 RepID=A0A6J8CG18_MYTCO|nr:unnamed protein product [Mytilus coruscus]
MAGFNNFCMIFFIIYIGHIQYISNEKLLNNSVASLCQKYISFRKYDRIGVNKTGNTGSDSLMWVQAKGQSLQWIQYFGCHVFNKTTEDELNNTKNVPINISDASYRIQTCITSCNTLDRRFSYFGLKDSTCYCLHKKLTSDAYHVKNENGGGISDNCCRGNNSIMLYSKTKDDTDNKTDDGRNCVAIEMTSDGNQCNTSLPYIYISCDETRSLRVTDEQTNVFETDMDCTKHIPNFQNTTLEEMFWIVIPRDEHILKNGRDIEFTCIMTKLFNNIVNPVIKECCNLSYYMMCNNNKDWTNKSSTSSFICSTNECIIYLSSIVTGIIGINVLAVLVCNAYRKRKTVRINERANRTEEEIQFDEMPTASSNLYEEHFDAGINQINHTESDEFNNAENEINGSKSQVKIDAIRQNKKTEEQAAAENQYNSLNHTLRKPDDAAKMLCTKKSKASSNNTHKGDQFIGTEYDSVDVLKRVTLIHTWQSIIYLSSIVTGIIGINVLAVLVCNAYRKRKTVRINERANRTEEEIQFDEMPTASSNLYEEHFDAGINQINHTESDEFNNAENEINGSKSQVKIDAIRQNKKTEEQAAAENQYNSLNHTLRKPDDAAKNAVYEKVKPAVITLIRGDQFIGTEYDSVDVLKE